MYIENSSQSSRKYRGILKMISRREKTRQIWENLFQQFERQQVPKMDGTRCLEGKASPAGMTSVVLHRNHGSSVKNKLSIKVMKFVKSLDLIGLEVTVTGPG